MSQSGKLDTSRILDLATVGLLLLGVATVARSGWDAYVRPALALRPVAISGWDAYGAQGHSLGSATAPVTLLWFADYECPACRRVDSVIADIREEFGDTVRFVHRHWPLEYHPQAYPAARAAECAADQGLFWTYHDRLLSTSGWLTGQEGFVDIAEAVGVPDLATFALCASAAEPVPRIEADIAAAAAVGGIGTPTIMVNGYRMATPDAQRIRGLIREEARRR